MTTGKHFDETEEFENCVAVRESEKAILVSGIPGYGDAWVPKSQLSEDSDLHGEGDEGTLVVSAWIAKERGWV